MLAEAAAREPDMEADTIDNVHVRVWRVPVADTPVHSFFKARKPSSRERGEGCALGVSFSVALPWRGTESGG